MNIADAFTDELLKLEKQALTAGTVLGVIERAVVRKLGPEHGVNLGRMAGKYLGKLESNAPVAGRQRRGFNFFINSLRGVAAPARKGERPPIPKI